MILINQHYEIVTHESSEDGEAAERGTNFWNREHDFHELVRLMEEHPECSVWNCRAGIDDQVWFNSHTIEDRAFIERGEHRTTSIHYADKNPPKNLKYWKWAAEAVRRRAVRRKAMLRRLFNKEIA